MTRRLSLMRGASLAGLALAAQGCVSAPSSEPVCEPVAAQIGQDVTPRKKPCTGNAWGAIRSTDVYAPRQGPQDPSRVRVAQPGESAETLASKTEVYSSSHMGVTYIRTGALDAEGNERSTADRFGVAAANIGLGLVNDIPYVGWAVRDNVPMREISFWEGFWGWELSADGTMLVAREAPPPYAPLTWIVGGVRAVSTFPASRGMYFLENAAYGPDPEDRNYALGVPVSIVAEPFHVADRTLLAAGNYLPLGRDFMDLVSGGVLAPDGKSIYLRNGEDIGVEWFTLVKVNGAAAAGIIAATQGCNGSNGGASAPLPYINNLVPRPGIE